MSMSTEAPFSITGKAGGMLVTLRGDSWEGITANAVSALGSYEAASAFLSEVYSQALKTPTSGALAVVAKALGPVSSVGQPLPVPGHLATVTQLAPPESTWQAPVPVAAATAPAMAAPASAPPIDYPGDCPHGPTHGPRPYRENMSKGKMWRRWECSVPWERGNDASNAQRCKAVNV